MIKVVKLYYPIGGITRFQAIVNKSKPSSQPVVTDTVQTATPQTPAKAARNNNLNLIFSQVAY